MLRILILKRFICYKNSVKGLNDYLSGANKDFSNVGIKAVDDYTLQYTLSQPEPYWNSKLTYSVTLAC